MRIGEVLRDWRLMAWVAERECEQKCEEERDDEEKGD